MSKKVIKFFILIMVYMMLFCGCGKKNLGNKYVEGSDYQYMFYSEQAQAATQARGDNGTFFAIKHFIYYLEDGADKAVPLCNKVDCLHDAETDIEKKGLCNAYINDVFYAEINILPIAYQDGYVYCVDEFDDEMYGGQALYRISEDGSKREKLYEWEDPLVQTWCVHRGVFYYVEMTYTNETVVENVLSVKKMELNSLLEMKPEIVYEVEEGLNVYSIAYLAAYGDYFYFGVVGDTAEDPDLITEENALDYAYHQYYAYNTKNKELIKILSPSDNPYEKVQNVVFWQDKIILLSYDFSQQDEVQDIYMTELDGSNPEVIFEDVPQELEYYSDGKYLYSSNVWGILWGKKELPVVMEVYDENLELVDTFTIPFLHWGQIGYQDSLFFHFTYEEEGKYRVKRFDKSKIGELNGAEITYDETVLELKLQ